LQKFLKSLLAAGFRWTGGARAECCQTCQCMYNNAMPYGCQCTHRREQGMTDSSCFLGFARACSANEPILTKARICRMGYLDKESVRWRVLRGRQLAVVTGCRFPRRTTTLAPHHQDRTRQLSLGLRQPAHGSSYCTSNSTTRHGRAVLISAR